MQSRRWWDVAVAAMLLTLAGLVWLVPLQATALERALVGFSLGGFLIVYLAFARPALGAEPGGRGRIFLALAALLVGIGTIGTPALACLQAIGYPLAWLLTGRRREAVIASAGFALAVGVGLVIGSGGSVEGWISAVITAGFSLGFAVALGLWITGVVEHSEERARLVAQLTAAQAEIEALSRERGAAAERERLARDLHDTLAQTLAGLVLLAERAGTQFRDGRTEQARAGLTRLEHVAREALTEARGLVVRTAAVPAEPAFEAAVQRLVDRFRAEAGLTIDVELPSVPELPLDRETQVVLLRCLQEALANVHKHARASGVTVRIRADGGLVGLTVSDDGGGFDPAVIRAGFGLDGMTERVALAGGELEVTAEPGLGTRLDVRLPLAGTLPQEVR